MKRKLVLLGIAGILLAGIVGWNLLADNMNMTQKEQKAEVVLAHGYTVGGVQLKAGKYLVVHKPDAMQAGKECTFFYRLPRHGNDEPVAKLRCTPSQGPVAKDFTLNSTRLPDGTNVVNSIQFAGSSEIHGFPTGS